MKTVDFERGSTSACPRCEILMMGIYHQNNPDLARRSKSGLARRPKIDSARESKQFRSSQKIEVNSARESKKIDSARESKQRRSSQKIEEDLARRSKKI